MYWNIMSTIISVAHSAITAVLGISLLTAVQSVLAGVVLSALLVLFKPLLLGIAHALMLVLKPKLSKEERLARRQMHDQMLLSSMLNAMDGAPSHAAELRALAARA